MSQADTISKLNSVADGGDCYRRYRGNLIFDEPTKLIGKITIDPGQELDPEIPTEFLVSRHVGGANVGGEVIRCEFGIRKLEGLYFLHSVFQPGTRNPVIELPQREAPRELWSHLRKWLSPDTKP